MVKIAVFGASKWPKLIWRKIWVAGKSWNFHIEYSQLCCPGLYSRFSISEVPLNPTVFKTPNCLPAEEDTHRNPWIRVMWSDLIWKHIQQVHIQAYKWPNIRMNTWLIIPWICHQFLILPDLILRTFVVASLLVVVTTVEEVLTKKIILQVILEKKSIWSAWYAFGMAMHNANMKLPFQNYNSLNKTTFVDEIFECILQPSISRQMT